MRSDNEKYISFSKYRSICRQYVCLEFRMDQLNVHTYINIFSSQKTKTTFFRPLENISSLNNVSENILKKKKILISTKNYFHL